MRQRKPTSQVAFIPWRFYFVIISISIIIFGLVIRVIDLTVIRHLFLQQQGDNRVLRIIKTPAFRGMIVDRNGYPLAVSTKVYSIWINPKEFVATKPLLTSLAKLLAIPTKNIQTIFNRYKKSEREFVYLKRSLSPEIAQKIKNLAIPGLYTQEEYRRYYPESEVTAHIVGYTNVDDNGQEGLELAYNDWLQGEKGKKKVVRDRLGRIIDDVQTIQEQKHGRDLVLSIDRRIQYLAYRALQQGVNENHAMSGSAVVLNVKTGEILAMVNQPSYNPNNHDLHYNEAIRNRAVTDLFEPGSTIKAFTVASALESGLYKPNSEIDTSPGWMRLDHHLVRDERDYGILSLARILQVSSNMGATRLALSLPTEQLWKILHRFGFGDITAVGFPGEQAGLLSDHTSWGDFTLASLSFGYGLSVTPLQLARSYAILANHGMKLPVTLLKEEKNQTGEQVLSQKIADEVLELLETVVEKGGGKKASIPGYRVAGKTGTSRKVGENGYIKHHYNSSFVGIAPVSDPQLVVAVVIQDPQGKYYYGRDVSAPIFKNIMEESLRILAIPPDAE